MKPNVQFWFELLTNDKVDTMTGHKPNCCIRPSTSTTVSVFSETPMHAMQDNNTININVSCNVLGCGVTAQSQPHFATILS